MSRPLDVQYITVSAATTAAAKATVSAVSGARLRILGLSASALAAQVLTLQSSTAGVYIGPVNLAAGVPATIAPTAIGLYETAASKGILCQLGNATQTFWTLQYQVINAT